MNIDDELDPITITIDDAGDAPALKKEEGTRPAERQIKTAEEGQADLAEQLATSRRNEAAAREHARVKDDEARQAREAEAAAKTQSVDSEHNAILRSIEAKEAEKARLRRDFAEASAAGDHEKLADIQIGMADVAADLRDLGRDKLAAENRVAQHDSARRQPSHEGRVETPVRHTEPPVDPVDKFISDVSSPKSQAWLSRNRDRIADQKALNQLLATHQQALADDVAVESPEYFERLEERLEMLTKKPAPRTEPTARAASYAAPASRDAPSYASRGNGRTSITLTPDQREAARISGMTDKQYAEQLIAIERERN